MAAPAASLPAPADAKSRSLGTAPHSSCALHAGGSARNTDWKAMAKPLLRRRMNCCSARCRRPSRRPSQVTGMARRQGRNCSCPSSTSHTICQPVATKQMPPMCFSVSIARTRWLHTVATVADGSSHPSSATSAASTSSSEAVAVHAGPSVVGSGAAATNAPSSMVHSFTTSHAAVTASSASAPSPLAVASPAPSPSAGAMMRCPRQSTRPLDKPASPGASMAAPSS